MDPRFRGECEERDRGSGGRRRRRRKDERDCEKRKQLKRKQLKRKQLQQQLVELSSLELARRANWTEAHQTAESSLHSIHRFLSIAIR